MKVYKAINAVQRSLSHSGIAKDRKNMQGSGYMFRGIDDVYNAIAPLLAEHGLCIVPRFMRRTCEERQSKSGGALFYVTVEAEFDFISAEDGSKHTARTFGEAMDSGDKATNKAMSAAYKYAAFQIFAIPTEGNPDADAETHHVEASASDPAPEVPKMPPAVIADWIASFGSCATIEELVTQRADALASAKKAQDVQAFSAIDTAARKRKAELEKKAVTA